MMIDKSKQGENKMKRLLMFVAAAVAITSSSWAAKTWTDENGAVWTYLSSGTKVTIRGYASPEGNVVIPESIDGKPVVTISSKAFKDMFVNNKVISIELQKVYRQEDLDFINVLNKFR